MATQKTMHGDAEALAVSALAFEAAAIRRAAREPGFLAGVLRFVVAHEPTLLCFAEQAGIEPGTVGAALQALPTGDDRYEAST